MLIAEFIFGLIATATGMALTYASHTRNERQAHKVRSEVRVTRRRTFRK